MLMGVQGGQGPGYYYFTDEEYELLDAFMRENSDALVNNFLKNPNEPDFRLLIAVLDPILSDILVKFLLALGIINHNWLL